MNEEMKMAVNIIVAEMDKRFAKMEERLDSMQQEINACKLERESVGLLIKK